MWNGLIDLYQARLVSSPSAQCHQKGRTRVEHDGNRFRDSVTWLSAKLAIRGHYKGRECTVVLRVSELSRSFLLRVFLPRVTSPSRTTLPSPAVPQQRRAEVGERISSTCGTSVVVDTSTQAKCRFDEKNYSGAFKSLRREAREQRNCKRFAQNRDERDHLRCLCRQAVRLRVFFGFRHAKQCAFRRRLAFIVGARRPMRQAAR